MVASNEAQKEASALTPAVETRRVRAMDEASHGSLRPDTHQQRPWLAHYHQGLPAHVSQPHQRIGVGGTPQCLQRPGRGRR